MLLGISKIVNNMELGHNVMHGQFDFMHDPEFAGNTFEWNHACPADFWRYTHNYEHHTYTNILGRTRISATVCCACSRSNAGSPASCCSRCMRCCWRSCSSTAGNPAPENEPAVQRQMGKAEFSERFRPFLRKLGQVSARDYLIFPLLAGPHCVAVLCGNLLANLIRNLWTWVIIFAATSPGCRSIPAIGAGERIARHWYLRQLRGSSNLKGSRLFHILSGNLSHQIEHHLFPDILANRYAEMAIAVRRICAKHGQHYNTGRFSVQFGSVLLADFPLRTAEFRRHTAKPAATGVIHDRPAAAGAFCSNRRPAEPASRRQLQQVAPPFCRRH